MSNIRLFIGLILFCVIALIIFSSYDISTLSIFSRAKFKYLPVIDINIPHQKGDDPKVINIFKKKYLLPPSNKNLNLTFPDVRNPSMGQAQIIDVILQQKTNGFYIECGALDGETRSNTLFFELERNWDGLLIEADLRNFELLKQKHRRAYASSTCLAPAAYPLVVNFQPQENMGHIVGSSFNNNGGPEAGDIFEAQCFPLLTYLKALNVEVVDYFSLDVEGAEFSILKSLPWDQLNIKTLSVEFIHNKEDKESILSFMKSKGYDLHSEVTHPQWLANDFIFVKEDLVIGALPKSQQSTEVLIGMPEESKITEVFH